LQLQKLREQQRELEQWAERRERDIEGQAGLLVAREQELDAQERHFEQQARQWQVQRAEYQQEIQRLLAELRGTAKAAA